MLSGDQILPIITSNVSVHPTEPYANPLMVWMESHDKFLNTPATRWFCRRTICLLRGAERLRELISHHEDRMLAIEEHCVDPRLRPKNCCRCLFPANSIPAR